MPVPIELDKPRTLRLNIGALGEIEDKLDGKPLAEVYVALLRRGINATVASLWAGLKHEDQTLTIPLTKKILQSYLDAGGQFQPVTDALTAAYKEVGVFNKDEDDEGNAPPEQARS